MWGIRGAPRDRHRHCHDDLPYPLQSLKPHYPRPHHPNTIPLTQHHSTLAAASKCDCYTATRTISPAYCPHATYLTDCIRPDCIRLIMTTIPGHNTDCPVTPTSTILSCATACPVGCGTAYSTVTASTSCLGSPCFTWTETATVTPASLLRCAVPGKFFLCFW